MDVLRPILVDGSLALVVGSVTDTLFSSLGYGKGSGTEGTGGHKRIESPMDGVCAASVAVGQAFVSVGLMARISSWLYGGGSGAELSDPTGGMLMMYVLFEASPGWRSTLCSLTDAIQAYTRDSLKLGTLQSVERDESSQRPHRVYHNEADYAEDDLPR